MLVRKIILFIAIVVSMSAISNANAIDFKSLTCGKLQQQAAGSYNVSCTAVIERVGFGSWYNAPWQECSSFCRVIGGVNTPSPDGFSCTSGEERPQSALGVVNYAPTGCWHNCRYPEGRRGASSVGHRCYAPGQKRDNDRTDVTVGCFCATGDVYSNVVDVGIYASGTAQSRGVTQYVEGWTNVYVAVMNDVPGRVSYIRGSIPLSTPATVHFVMNITGGCGTRVMISGRTNGSGGTTDTSDEVVIALPDCEKQCKDGLDNDHDGFIDDKDFSCIASKGKSEYLPKAACQNGLDDDHDGLIDQKDPGCSNSQDDSEDNCASPCDDISDHLKELKALEDIIRAQRDVVYGLVDRIIKTAANPTVKAKAQGWKDLASTVKRDLVRDIYKKYPSTTQHCPACSDQDLTEVKDDFVARSRKMQRLTKQVAGFVQEVNAGLNVRTSLQTADSLFEQFQSAVLALPSRTSLCPISGTP